jgi:hypothetical protein
VVQLATISLGQFEHQKRFNRSIAVEVGRPIALRIKLVGRASQGLAFATCLVDSELTYDAFNLTQHHTTSSSGTTRRAMPARKRINHKRAPHGQSTDAPQKNDQGTGSVSKNSSRIPAVVGVLLLALGWYHLTSPAQYVSVFDFANDATTLRTDPAIR